MENKTPSLAEIQKMLQDAVISRERLAPAIGEWIEVKTPGPTAAERIAVYGDGWYLRLEESLRDDYPEVYARLGEERWEEFTHSYLRVHPSSDPSLARASDRLPEYLLDWDHSLRGTEIAELAILERAIYLAYAIRDSEIWKVDELATMSEDEAETLRFELQPSVTLHKFNWNTFDLQTKVVDPAKTPQNVVVFREGLVPQVLKVPDSEFKFLSRLESRPLLTELITEFEGSDWMQWIARFAGLGILSKQKSE